MEHRYYNEDELVQKYQRGEISMVDYIDMHSPEWQNEYIEFCSRENRDLDEQSAEDFLEWKGQQFEEALLIGNA